MDNYSDHDSDDELLGITTDHTSPPDRSNTNNNDWSPPLVSNKYEPPTSRPTLSQPYTSLSSRKNISSFKDKSGNRDHCRGGNSLREWTGDTTIPSMEIIDTSYLKREFKQEKTSKYQRMRESHNVIGFVVNVHDATNFDIDFELSPDLHEKYRDVISNQYTYQDLGVDFLENPDLNRLIKITPEVGTTYRCRLRGVGINQLSYSDHTWKSNQMCVDVRQLIDRTDGWITCTLSDIDVYQRLLVDISIHTGNGIINLRDYLLDRMKLEETPIFYPYSGKI